MTRRIFAGSLAVVMLSCATSAVNLRQPRVDLIRPAGTRAYELIVTEEGAQWQRTRTRFVLHTASPTDEWFEVVDAWLQRATGPENPVTLDPACRREFGGTDTTLGRVHLSMKSMDLTTLAPACVPEALFGALTDILTFFLVQVPEHHGIEKLHAAGDSVDVAPFTTTWSRPPQLLAARFASPGGWTKLIAAAENRAIVRFSTGASRLDLLRVLGPDNRGFLTGVERLELQLDIDSRTGELTGGRSVVDELDMTLFMKYPGDRLPEPGAVPSSGGFPVKMRRTLELTAAR